MAAPRLAETAPLTGMEISARLPFNRPPLATLRASPRKVFAHWHWFPMSFENAAPAQDYYATQFLQPEGEAGKYAAMGGYLRQRPLARAPIADPTWRRIDMENEVRRAAAVGIDGFIFNILSPDRASYLWSQFTTMLDAAEAVDPGFAIIPNIDATAIPSSSLGSVVASLETVVSHPGLYRLNDGRLVISAFGAEAWPKATWQTLVSQLRAAFVPVFVSWQPDVAPDNSYGLSLWGPACPPEVPGLSQPASAARAARKIWMAPVRPQDFRAKDLIYWEAANSRLFRTMWEQAINDEADWVQLITWNDHSEGSELRPSTGTQYGFYDLLAYYITWYKTGVRPAIARDVIYYFHRIAPVAAQPDLGRQARRFQKRGLAVAADAIELRAFLTRPGILEIAIGDKKYQKTAAAGEVSFKVPLAEGTPHFRLYRNGNAAIDFASAFSIRDEITYQDLLYRSGSSTRARVDFVANPPVP